MEAPHPGGVGDVAHENGGVGGQSEVDGDGGGRSEPEVDGGAVLLLSLLLPLLFLPFLFARLALRSDRPCLRRADEAAG